MTMKEAMEARHTVRKYLDKPIPEEVLQKLRERMVALNAEFGLDIRLRVGDPEALSGVYRLLGKNVKNYFILAGRPAPDLQERLGYCAADLILYAQTLGLNTWIIGGTYNKKAVARHAEGLEVAGIVAVGYGATQGVPHRSRRPEMVSDYEGPEPPWFLEGVRAALLAPTSLNRQKFFVKGRGNEVSIRYKNGACAGVNLGLVKYHFELGAGKGSFNWPRTKKKVQV